MKYSTAGSMGDSIYQTLFMVELAEAMREPIEQIHIQYGKPGSFSQPHVYGDKQLTYAAAKYMAPLFEAQGWKTSISEDVPSGFIDIDQFRSLRLNFSSGDIRLWCYNMMNLGLPMDLQRATIKVEPNKDFSGRVIFAKTSRYNNRFLNYASLEPIREKLVMIGLEEEHKDFCSDYFNVDFYKTKDALDAAQAIAGADCMISNQCGLYSIAEMMKTPRILCTAEYIVIKHPYTQQDTLVPGPVNVIPQGGRCAMAGVTGKLATLIERM